jgi:hypothetical protein
MESHEDYVLSLDDDLDAVSLRALYQRFAESPCPSDDVFANIADHPSAPPDVLRALARRRSWGIDLSLGVNPSTPVDILVKLSHRCFDDVVEHVIWNRSTPPEELMRLADHGRSKLIRAWAAQALDERGIRPASPEELRRLARSSASLSVQIWAIKMLDERWQERVPPRVVRRLEREGVGSWIRDDARRLLAKWARPG